ncbi:hypothetical protein ACOXXX_11925 [Thalassococcus sp. BH17M4-6]|uniref:hypothetical protein n=1 Tax=Thalassococcus sp. BH17M4-6 TaxID=3413148 RepID=UPI003BD9C36E
MSTLFFLLPSLAVVAIAVIAIDLMIGRAILWLSPILADDVAGPDGWLLDTQGAKGVFDRRPRLPV